MEKTQYKDTLKRVTTPIPETECLVIGFSNDINPKHSPKLLKG
jgi:hypothetical protein